jgi:CBS domain containing-hemolysin-like protein
MDGFIGYRLLLLLLIIAVNGFFAAAEVSLVSVRRSRLRTMAEEGTVGAQAALSLLENPERLLSVTQVGVTLTSLALGWAGEETIFNILNGLLQPVVPHIYAPILHGGAFVLSFLIMTYAHVVIGEVVPKNLAIESADNLAVIVAPALLLFYRVMEPFVFIIERSSVALSRLFGVRGHSRGGGHSAEELKFVIASSRTEGYLLDFEEDAIQRLIDLHDISAREIMVPRNSIVSMDVNASLDRVLRVLVESQYSRLPVYEEKPEKIVGIINYKDLLPVWDARRRSTERRRAVPPFNLRLFLRKPVVVPETKPANQLIDEFRKNHSHMALVVDEFGTISGLVTLEDVLEQIFGEIEDEFDVRRPAPALEAPVLELDGSTTILDLETQYGIELNVEEDFETLAGFVLFHLGYIPSVGDSFKHGGRRFTVLEMDRNRIARVRVEKLPEPPPPEPLPTE